MQQNDYLSAIDTFLQDWNQRDYVEGAILAGSYAFGTQTEKSDIDIMIVLNNSITWWERGNTRVNDFLIEYIADPEFFWKESFENEFNSRQKVSVHMFATGKILFDKNGIVEKLNNTAKELYKRPFTAMDTREIEMAKYHLYDGGEKLNNLQGKPFEQYAMLYFLHLSRLITFYASFLQISLPATAKIYHYFNTAGFREKYNLQDFPDTLFITMVNNCLTNFSSMKFIQELTQYVLDKLGGFTIDGWILRTDIKK